ncbi:hypothetical protein E1301_Tti017606 [Triplophysa tibetana]|uniref:Uncharacterized protein n=1 Tax=Triplophysa tibetana TaxID=1572043 RepID=A0A5A9P0L5_9TELE|nr:hypothetical protein E1301_Tti017606 [Triplophysa tibetana]
MQGVHPGVVAFRAAVALIEGNLWEKAFAVCRRIQQTGPTALGQGTAKLTRQPPVVIPPQTEMVLWCRTSDEVPRDNCTVLIEPLADEESSWLTARSVAIVHDGHLPLRLCNPTMQPVEVPQRRPLAEVTLLPPEHIVGQRELILTPGSLGVVEVGVSTVCASPSTLPPGLEQEDRQTPPLTQCLRSKAYLPSPSQTSTLLSLTLPPFRFRYLCYASSSVPRISEKMCSRSWTAGCGIRWSAGEEVQREMDDEDMKNLKELEDLVFP